MPLGEGEGGDEERREGGGAGIAHDLEMLLPLVCPIPPAKERVVDVTRVKLCALDASDLAENRSAHCTSPADP